MEPKSSSEEIMEYECSICNNKYLGDQGQANLQPMVSESCGHTICEACWNEIPKHHITRQVVCPTCDQFSASRILSSTTLECFRRLQEEERDAVKCLQCEGLHSAYEMLVCAKCAVNQLIIQKNEEGSSQSELITSKMREASVCSFCYAEHFCNHDEDVCKNLGVEDFDGWKLLELEKIAQQRDEEARGRMTRQIQHLVEKYERYWNGTERDTPDVLSSLVDGIFNATDVIEKVERKQGFLNRYKEIDGRYNNTVNKKYKRKRARLD